jgi:hypothetical protein
MIRCSSYLFDNTLLNGVSSLHDKIIISTDGTSFHALADDDVVVLKGSRVIVHFKSAQNADSLYFKIAADTFSDLAGNIQTTDLISGKVKSNMPNFKGNFYSNAPSEFLFEDNVIWRNKIESVSIYEQTNNDSAFRVLNPSEYSIHAGKIVINPGVFKYGVNYELDIYAEGYDYQFAEGVSILPNETYIMTAPALTRTGGITASVNVMGMYDPYNEGNGPNYEGTNHNATIIFQLLNGTIPVSIVALDSYLADGTYTANFNVTDATNPNYTVKAFIVSKYSNDPTNVGLNLATVITQNELDQVSNNRNNFAP